MSKYMSLVFLISSYASLMADNDQKIEIINDTNNNIDINFVVPERTAAMITMVKLKNQQEALHQGILNDSADAIIQAFQNGADINQEKDGKSSLLWAVLLKKENAVGALLRLGSKPNDIMFEYAVKSCGEDMVILLLDTKFNFSSIGSLLNHSITRSQYKIAALLAKAGADIKSCPSILTNLLHAIRHTNGNDAINILQIFVDNGLNIDSIWDEIIRSVSGRALLKKNFITFLSKNQANLNVLINDSGSCLWSPLLKTIQFGGYESVMELLKEGANPNLKGKIASDHSPLSYAISLGHDKIVQILLEYGANL